ncbi:MAG: hypothetical protein KAS96_02560 [Planctomycetes bacterium]|nr:hypothetical protein [Planctomycetota bacterium]
MNVKKFKILSYCLVAMMASVGLTESAHQAVKQGNELYHQAELAGAIEKYDQAATQSPQALEPTFNKANSLYKQNEIDKAVDLYKQLAGKSENPNLSAKANYNLGNCYYNKADSQTQTNPQNAIKDFKTGINYWRKAKDSDLDNADISKNIEVAKMTIKQLKEQMQQQKQENQQDKNKDEQNKDQQKQDQKQNSSSDPNQPQQEKQDQQQADDDPNQDQSQAPEPKEEEKPTDEPEEDMVAQKILDKEQKQKEERKKLRRATYKKVEKDW